MRSGSSLKETPARVEAGQRCGCRTVRSYAAARRAEQVPGAQTSALAATLIDSAIRLALKKQATMQCTVPTIRMAEPMKVMSAVWAEVPDLGRTETDRNADLVKQQAAAEGKTVEQIAADTAKKAGVRRLGQPEDVAALTVFLVSAAASHIQGAAISVDGGGTKGLF